MSIISDYIEKAGSNFLTVKNCPVGTILTITGITLDEETFDKPYVILAGTVPSFEDEVNYRCGVGNLKRIAEAFGEAEKQWIGKQIECIAHQDYPGLQSRGLLWRGLVAGASSAPSGPAMGDIIGKIMVANPQMTAKAVKKLIDAEVKKAEGLLTEDAAAHIVASTLGVDLG